MKSLGDIAIAVAQIPFKTWVIPSSGSLKIENNNDEEAHLYSRGHSGHSGGAGAGNPGNMTNSFHAPITSTSSMILNRRGTLMEHAILLCGLFLGRGVNAYVAVGWAKSRPFVWVVTIDHTSYTLSNREEKEEHILEFTQLKYQYESDYDFYEGAGRALSLDQEKFASRSSMKKAKKDRSMIKVIHWDVMSGSCFSRSDDKETMIQRNISSRA